MKLQRIGVALLGFILLLTMPLQAFEAGMVSPGVHHESKTTSFEGKSQRVNQLSINLGKPYTTIDIGISNPFTSLATTSALARQYTKEQHHVVGAVNASFFTFANGLPTYLLAEGNEIVNLGAVSTNYNDFMHTPAAFGVTPDNKAKISTYELDYTITHKGKSSTINSLNIERESGDSVLYTSSWSYETTRTNSTGMEVVVETAASVNTGRDFGERITGTVKAVRPYGQSQASWIPKNGFVLSASGTAEVDKLRNMKVGDQVDLTIDVEQDWKGAKFMLATGPLLVQNGAVNMTIDSASPRAIERTARTAVAVNENGTSAYFVTVDSAIAGSSGMTLPEFARYLKTLGVHTAINLDGGGSTTMIARKYGDVYPSLVNRPSQGMERKVSAILQAISTAPYGSPTSVKASPNAGESTVIGESVGFKADQVVDQYYNVLNPDQSKLKLETVSGGIGKIENNRFTGTKAGNGTISATYEGVTVSIPVTVTEPVVTLSGLDSTSGLSFASARATGSIETERMIKPQQGSGSVKLNYDFTKNKEGVSAAYLKWNSPYKIPGAPKRIGFWVYGDTMNHWLRGSLKDASGKDVIVDFTAEGKLDWAGWKYVEATIPATAIAPLTFNQLYVAETRSTNKTKGAIRIDGMQAVYQSKATVAPTFKKDSNARTVTSDKQFTVTFSQAMNEQFLHNKYVYVEDELGNRQAVTVKKGNKPEQVIIDAPKAGYEKNKHYRLVVTHFVPNKKNIRMMKDSITQFQVK
ncbi:phosphodiester glycosidase family protein [Planomicrobium sp. YIM 101495]|uniref:phosphodiester glycosidase family protein n=1 Tax=Planomicrobium sp. YIM 101495 TaxID=2665160 RepID=UPI0012B7AC4E|nr:phosphodiester glycosidase family protein [Planomicrobium sp. YIM 101495]MTD30503.1 hypothetical protein [Planomicrobium sp. YIM 101495]